MRKLFTIFLLFILTGCNLNLDDFNPNKDDIEDNSSDDTIQYFEVQDLEYTGPYLDQEYRNITEVYNNTYGTGHVFDVTLIYSYDGDTSYFNLPNGYDSYYPKNSFRYFAIDTAEIGNNIEEWGVTAGNYTRSVLENSYAIALQSDPNNTLLDGYDRGLAWIWVKETSTSNYELLNFKILQQGLGEVKYAYDSGTNLFYNNKTYISYMYQAEQEAQNNNRGIHSNLLDPNWTY